MSDQGEPDRPGERGGQPDEAGRDAGAGRADGLARAGQGNGDAADGPDDRGTSAGRGRPAGRALRSRGLPHWARVAVAILGPILMTVAYFTLPFQFIGPEHPLLAWVLLVCLLVLLAIGMGQTTISTIADAAADQPGHPGLRILLYSWASILAFAASYWAMAVRHNQFVGLQTRLDSLYFTGVTVGTVGYGDIHASGQVARAVVLLQLVYTFVFLVGGITAVRTRSRAKMARRGGG
jgi:hypothetical protein